MEFLPVASIKLKRLFYYFRIFPRSLNPVLISVSYLNFFFYRLVDFNIMFNALEAKGQNKPVDLQGQHEYLSGLRGVRIHDKPVAH